MPPPPPSGTKKKKKGRPPKHQNSFAFRHNPKSKKTDKILASPNVGVCRRCYDKIEWRKKYRKYKPLSQPAKCNLCCQKNILAAYHTICTSCACSDRAVNAMKKRQHDAADGIDSTAHETTCTTTTPTSPKKSESENGDALLSIDTTVQGAAAESLSSAIDFDDASNSDRKSLSKLRIRVCAVCTNEPAISKYSNASAEDMDIIELIQELENALELGLDIEDGHKMTLRELKGVERKVEKYQLELKQRRSQAKRADEKEDELDEEKGGGENITDNEGSVNSSSGGIGDDNSAADTGSVDDTQELNEIDDPFLLATGGKALVGEEYQKMLLAREQHKTFN